MVSGNPQVEKTRVQNNKKVTTDRLSKALRNNLYRRKAQARARKANVNAPVTAGQQKKDDV